MTAGRDGFRGSDSILHNGHVIAFEPKNETREQFAKTRFPEGVAKSGTRPPSNRRPYFVMARAIWPPTGCCDETGTVEMTESR